MVMFSYVGYLKLRGAVKHDLDKGVTAQTCMYSLSARAINGITPQILRSRCKLSRRVLSQVSYRPPDLSNVDQQWDKMQLPLKEEVIEYLNWKMEDDWKKMPVIEKKAIYHISYGDFGPRASSGAGTVSPVYLLWKSLFSGILFLALGVSILNVKRDRKINSQLRNLQDT